MTFGVLRHFWLLNFPSWSFLSRRIFRLFCFNLDYGSRWRLIICKKVRPAARITNLYSRVNFNLLREFFSLWHPRLMCFISCHILRLSSLHWWKIIYKRCFFNTSPRCYSSLFYMSSVRFTSYDIITLFFLFLFLFIWTFIKHFRLIRSPV